MTARISWAAYALDHYFNGDRYAAIFPPHAKVVDVGCGDGRDVMALRARGYEAVGTEPVDELVRAACARGVPILKAPAEALPFPDASIDGVIFKSVLPYTDHTRTFTELARVLKPGGRLEALYNGPGFGLRHLAVARDVRTLYYAVRSLTNTVLLHLIDRKLPGKYGDAGYDSPAALRRRYAAHGFTLLEEKLSPPFMGSPVFIYHSVQRNRSPDPQPGDG